jgi:16S rRNA (guanine527-N7)-methyltransferase
MTDNTANIITSHFPDLSKKQVEQFEALLPLYADWNSKINVISRKDMDSFYLHHVLHSLGIAKVNPFMEGASVLDVGTGGGFPGIPLAIMFPGTQFHLVDSIGKKIKVVNEVATELGLRNVKASHARAEEVKSKFDFIISRAVTRLKPFSDWVKTKLNPAHKHQLANGLLLLKGGDLDEEIAESELFVQEFNLAHYFKEPFFETKKVVYVPYTEF